MEWNLIKMGIHAPILHPLTLGGVDPSRKIADLVLLRGMIDLAARGLNPKIQRKCLLRRITRVGQGPRVPGMIDQSRDLSVMNDRGQDAIDPDLEGENVPDQNGEIDRDLEELRPDLSAVIGRDLEGRKGPFPGARIVHDRAGEIVLGLEVGEIVLGLEVGEIVLGLEVEETVPDPEVEGIVPDPEVEGIVPGLGTEEIAPDLGIGRIAPGLKGETGHLLEAEKINLGPQETDPGPQETDQDRLKKDQNHQIEMVTMVNRRREREAGRRIAGREVPTNNTNRLPASNAQLPVQLPPRMTMDPISEGVTVMTINKKTRKGIGLLSYHLKKCRSL